MKKRLLKKSDVLREGYVKGLKEAQRIINKQLIQESPEKRKGVYPPTYEKAEKEITDTGLLEAIVKLGGDIHNITDKIEKSSLEKGVVNYFLGGMWEPQDIRDLQYKTKQLQSAIKRITEIVDDAHRQVGKDIS